MNIRIPRIGGEELVVSMAAGRTAFVVGANGAGKSSLMQSIFANNQAIAKRISAHRQTWFQSNTLELTAAGKRQTERSMASHDAQPDARWTDHHGTQRASVTLFELIDAENVAAREIADAARARNTNLMEKLIDKLAPLASLNHLLKLANLPIDVTLRNNEQLFACRAGSQPYSIAELSDGERNAILIIGTVLTAKAGSLLLIDEPERHLHRSIVAPLLLALFEHRSDCGFVISTHDVSLPLDSPEATTLILRACEWQGQQAVRWDVDLLEPEAPLSDEVRLAILGARKKILFVEGTNDSLDRHIYSLLFPSISVKPCGSCHEVERAVGGLRAADGLHWVTAYGLIDKDDRTPEQVAERAAQGVFATDCYSVESLYYSVGVMTKIAERQNAVVPNSASVDRAKAAIVEQLRPHRERLCARVVERKATAQFERAVPTHETLIANPIHAIRFDGTQLLADERQLFDGWTVAGDADALIQRYPVRETGALAEAARQLGFSHKSKYETAVRKLILDDDATRVALRARLGGLAQVA
jgi:ABC-type ATPase involved in cell division